MLDARAAIRVALEQLAEKHRIPMREVNASMGWADQGLADLVYQTENDLVHEIEEQAGLRDGRHPDDHQDKHEGG